MKRLTAAHFAAWALAALVSCGGGDPGPELGLGGGAPILNGAGGGNDFMSEPGADDTNDGTVGGRCAATPDDTSCIGETYAGESIPLDIYIMFDQSGSMCTCLDADAAQTCPNPSCSETRLDAVRRATEQFLNDPQSAGIGVGLGLFGKQPIGQASCDTADYAAPAVGIGELPDHAAVLAEALADVAPTGETPTGAALRGACDYARGWNEAHADRKVVILLLTDGKPEAPATCQGGSGPCCPSLDDAVSAAEQCRQDAEIDTYVLGVGPLLENLEQIAAAGGTDHAYLVEGGDVSDRVLAALNRIRGAAAIPCNLALPEPPSGQTLDPSKVNLEYSSSACERTLLYSVQSSADCGAEDGWYYDDPQNPQLIHLCPRSCDRVSAPGGTLEYSVGCETQFRIR